MHARRLTAAFTLVPLLFAQPAALLTQTLRPSDPQGLLPAAGTQAGGSTRWPAGPSPTASATCFPRG